MLPPPLTEDARVALRRRCRELHGHAERSPAERLRATAEWCEVADAEPDFYSAGGVLAELEADMVERLGHPAAAFFPSGTMAQNAALLVHAGRRGGRGACAIGMHPLAHPLLHEEGGWHHLLALDVSPLGEADRPVLARDLEDAPRLDLGFIELPVREAGGVLPTNDELDELVTAACERGVLLHLDGARLWEASVGLDRGTADIGRLFDSVYVSLYKGIGGLSGAVLAGDREFIAEARLWRRRMGGTLPNQVAAVASAAALIEDRLARMPAWLERARGVAACFRQAGARVQPETPQTNLFHAYFAFPRGVLLAARNSVAEECGVWLFGHVADAKVPGWSRIELYCSDQATALADDELQAALSRLFHFAAAYSA